MSLPDILLHRLRTGCETIAWPKGPPPPLPDRHPGRLDVNAGLCAEGCVDCLDVCPVAALSREPGEAVRLDLGRCLFCKACLETCPTGAIVPSRDHRMAVRTREDLQVGGAFAGQLRLAQALDKKLQRLFGRSLKLRQVSAGGCNACESDINVLGTIGWDLGRFGIQFVASPRHADGLVVTGPVSRNMELALRKTYEALPEPRIVIAVGACAIAGGPFAGLPEHHQGLDSILPVDLYIPGCPPPPLTILDGFLRLLGRLEDEGRLRACDQGPGS